MKGYFFHWPLAVLFPILRNKATIWKRFVETACHVSAACVPIIWAAGLTHHVLTLSWERAATAQHWDGLSECDSTFGSCFHLESCMQWPLTIMILILQVLRAGNYNEFLDQPRELLLQSPGDSPSEDDIRRGAYSVITIPRMKLKMRTIHKYLSTYIKHTNNRAVTICWYNKCTAIQWEFMASSVYVVSPVLPLTFFASCLKFSRKPIWTVCT